MNKSELNQVKKHFKLDDSYLKIREICEFYVNSGKQILARQCEHFSMMNEEKQELFVKNFKKLLSGQMDSNLFELEFQKGAKAQSEFIEIIDSDTLEEDFSGLLDKILTNNDFGMDIMATFTRAEIYMGGKKKQKGTNSTVSNDYTLTFIMCSINKVDTPKRALAFDSTQKEFKTELPMNRVVNINSPITGFMFPSFTESSANVNNVLYYTKKKNEPMLMFVENVLECEMQATVKDDVERFQAVLKEVIGNEIGSETLSRLYENMFQEINHDPESTLGIQDIERILGNSGINDVSRVVSAFDTIVNKHYRFKTENLLPANGILKLDFNPGTLSLGFPDLKNLKQIEQYGERILSLNLAAAPICQGFNLAAD